MMDPYAYDNPPPPQDVVLVKDAGPKNPLRFIIFGCLGTLAFLVVLGVGIFFFVKSMTQGAESVVSEFVAAAAAGDYDTAYNDFFSAALKQAQSREEFRRMAAANRHLFAFADVTYTSRNTNPGKVELKGWALLESGDKVDVHFIMVKEDGSWKLNMYNIALR